MKEAVDVAVQLKSDRIREEAQAENQQFLDSIDEGMKKVIKEQVKSEVSKITPKIEKLVNEQLESEVLVRSSKEAKTSHAVAANLSELELKKILIDKMEANKSIIARLEAIRIFFDYAAYMGFVVYQMDVKSSFLNGKLSEDVYIQKPPGFESSEFPNYLKMNMWLLLGVVLKSYGLKVSWLIMMFTMIRYHFIKDHILKGDIELHFIPTDLQLADIFTKPLANPSFTRLVAELAKTSESSSPSTKTHVTPALNVIFECDKEYLREYWYSAEYNENYVSLPTKETVRAGLETLGLVDEKNPDLSSTDLESHDQLSINQMKGRDPNPIGQPKASTNKGLMKKKYLSSFEPKTSKNVRKSQSKKQVTKTQHVKESMSTADATKSTSNNHSQTSLGDRELESSHPYLIYSVHFESTPGNDTLKFITPDVDPENSRLCKELKHHAHESQALRVLELHLVSGEHVKLVEEIVEDPLAINSGIKSLGNVNLDELLKDKIVNVGAEDKMEEADSELESMPNDEVISILGNEDEEEDSDRELSIADEIDADKVIDTLVSIANKEWLSLLDKFADKIDSLMPRMVADAFKERMPEFISHTLMNILS
ncbi:retrovirus-related pol polyprotein from transposon TNT 1-94 [Tanacetum coccineum]